MQKDQQKLIELIKGKKVAFIGAGVSHKTLIKEFVCLLYTSPSSSACIPAPTLPW